VSAKCYYVTVTNGILIAVVSANKNFGVTLFSAVKKLQLDIDYVYLLCNRT